MFKIIFQHKVLEYCINLIFEAINKNFINTNQITVGKTYAILNVIFPQANSSKQTFPITYKNCKITRVGRAKVFGEEINAVFLKPSNFDYELVTSLESVYIGSKND